MSQTTQPIQFPLPREGFPLSSVAARPYRSADRTALYNGYLYQEAQDHPRANVWGYWFQHCLVAEHVLGRSLQGAELVHHEDRTKTNNSPTNLIVFPDQSAHRSHHMRQEAPCHRPELIERLRALAPDRTLTLPMVAERLEVDQQTVAAMLRRHSIPWEKRSAAPLDERLVREALARLSTAEAAKALGVHHHTLRNRFPHLLSMRVSPGSLEHRREEIRSLARSVRGDALGVEMGVNPATVKASIRRWAKEEPDAWLDVLAFQRSRRGISSSRGRTA